MAEYIVAIDNEEVNKVADVVSITGRVNGAQCAAKVRLSKLSGLPSLEQKKVKQKALVDAYENKAQETMASSGEKVVL